MPNQGNPLLSVRLPDDLYQLLMQKVEESGLDRSKVAIEALTMYLRPPEPQDEMAQLKQQMENMQRAIANMGNQTTR
jgi:hypothetical protein